MRVLILIISCSVFAVYAQNDDDDDDDDEPGGRRAARKSAADYGVAVTDTDAQLQRSLEHTAASSANRQWRNAEMERLGGVKLQKPYRGHNEEPKWQADKLTGSPAQRARVCPPNSHDSMHKRCVCEVGFDCIGTRCYKTPGRNSTTFDLFGAPKCPDCRCDRPVCNAHRVACGTCWRPNRICVRPLRTHVYLRFIHLHA